MMARAPLLQDAEALPEADRLDDFPHPRETRVLFGHHEAERALAEALKSGRIHHAWLLAGPEGIGKATLAYRFAAHALADSEERERSFGELELPNESATIRQIRALSHPGLLVIRRPYDPRSKRFTSAIPVEEVRRLRAFLSHTAGEQRGRAVRRIVIVDQADELNPSSANALLKSLEEPPAATVFLLITAQPGRLLPTIRSRCRVLTLAPLGAHDLRQAAEQALAASEREAPDSSAWPQLLRLANGSVRRVLTLATEDGLTFAKQLHAIFDKLPDVDWGAAHALADELSAPSAEQRFESFFDLLLDKAAHLARAAATGEGEPDEVAQAARIIPEGRLASWAELWETVVREKAEALALNLDRKTLILATLSRLQGVSRH